MSSIGLRWAVREWVIENGSSRFVANGRVAVQGGEPGSRRHCHADWKLSLLRMPSVGIPVFSSELLVQVIVTMRFVTASIITVQIFFSNALGFYFVFLWSFYVNKPSTPF